MCLTHTHAQMGQCASTTTTSKAVLCHVTMKTRKRTEVKTNRHHREEGGVIKRNNLGWFATVREKRSRCYIVRRCILMLILWHKYGKI